ncbi:MAG: TonB family protein, partial [Cyanobacteria bacterium J06650_10]
SAENKSEVDSATATLEIDSQFKVCKENAPSTGLIGVVVNPDGSQENAEVLKSIGYDILNRQALAAIEYNEFEQPSQATQYQITIDVIYEPEGCVEALPEAEE